MSISIYGHYFLANVACCKFEITTAERRQHYYNGGDTLIVINQNFKFCLNSVLLRNIRCLASFLGVLNKMRFSLRVRTVLWISLTSSFLLILELLHKYLPADSRYRLCNIYDVI